MYDDLEQRIRYSFILCYNVLSDRRNSHRFDHHHHGQLTCRKIIIPFRREYQRVMLGRDKHKAYEQKQYMKQESVVNINAI